ncbi:MAG: serine/threonine protein kinase [Clostridia bacterium]|nr:serine/threonine protein kinase [Clostridia bacterium]
MTGTGATREEYLARLLTEYRVVSVLSEKNGCRTLRLRHRALGRDLVLHLLPFCSPVYETLRSLRCVNLPEVYDAVRLSDGEAVLEEYVDGVTVAAVTEIRRYRYREAREVMIGVCSALAVLHERALVHRDVKPENVMISATGRVVLIDFNVSRTVSDRPRDTVVMGTVGYAPPEQLGIAQSDARADIYAAGVLFNVMLTGCHPSETLAPGRAGRIVKKCTQVNPKDRYQNVRRLLNAL